MKKFVIFSCVFIIVWAMAFVVPFFGAPRYTSAPAVSDVDVRAQAEAFSDSISLMSPEYQRFDRTLVVQLYDETFELPAFGAAHVAQAFGGLYILEYECDEDASLAYLQFQSIDNVKSVLFDQPVLPAGAANEDSYLDTNPPPAKTASALGEAVNNSKWNGTYNFLSWGASFMGIAQYTTVLRNLRSQGTPLREVVVAVLDSGICYDHHLFHNRIVVDYAKNFTTGEQGGRSAFDNNTRDNHGTHVSGIIADLTLPNVKILPLKVMNHDGVGAFSSVIAAMNYVSMLRALDTLDIVAINMSLAIPAALNSVIHIKFTQAVNSLYTQNVLTVAAAGNTPTNAVVDVVRYSPANVARAITVTRLQRINDNQGLAFFRSNQGAFVDLSAPGGGTGDGIRSASVGGGYRYLTGTSMAAPHVAAVIALIYSNPYNNHSATELTNILIAQSVGVTAWNGRYGHGLLTTGLSPLATSLNFGSPHTSPNNDLNNPTPGGRHTILQFNREIELVVLIAFAAWAALATMTAVVVFDSIKKKAS